MMSIKDFKEEDLNLKDDEILTGKKEEKKEEKKEDKAKKEKNIIIKKINVKRNPKNFKKKLEIVEHAKLKNFEPSKLKLLKELFNID